VLSKVETQHETIDADIVFAGAGPAGLSAAIHLRQLIDRHNLTSPERMIEEPELLVLEKSRHSGGHLLSGALLDPCSLKRLFPDFIERGCPVETGVSDESVWFLTRRNKIPLPYLPEPFRNDRSLVISISKFGSWLQRQAEELGITVLDSTAVMEPVIEEGRVTAIRTDDKGTGKNGQKKPGAEPGLQINTRTLVVGEGSRGSIFRQLDERFGLQPQNVAQIYETGVKEVWKVPEGRVKAGDVHHTFGYPLPSSVYGGGWIYAMTDTSVSLGFVSTAEPDNPTIDPHWNLQQFKLHPFVTSILEGGSLLEYGAKTITSGGYHAMPALYGPGFLLVGETAGMVNMQRLKGIHLAISSGMLAAETLFAALLNDDFSAEGLKDYARRFEMSDAHSELHAARHYRQAFNDGLYSGLVKAGLKLSVPGLKRTERSSPKERLKPGNRAYESFVRKRENFRPDGRLTFSRSDDLYASATRHEEDQPCHLKISPDDISAICAVQCREEYGNPCQYFCPAGVYEIDHDATPVLRLNPSNCLHCKTCDIADPYGIITWTPPEGGGGPDYKTC